MFGDVLKAYMPRSLYGRATLILLVPVLTLLAVVFTVFVQRLYEDVTFQMTRGVADEIAFIMSRIEAEDDREQALTSALVVADALDIRLDFDVDMVSDRREWFDLSGLTIENTLKEALPGVVALDLTESVSGRVAINYDTRHGLARLLVERDELSPRNPHQFLVYIGLTALLMTIIALLYLRGQVRPIRRLAAAAAAFGKGRTVPYRPAGATEVRAAGQAFIEMRDRIERQIEQRTMMLSGVSHDLRTPLTRMRLALSLSEETEETSAILQDVAEMEHMLDAFLSFARSEAFDEPEMTTVGKLLNETKSRSERAGHRLELVQIAEEIPIRVRPLAFARAIDNLIGNAGRYAETARLSAKISPSHIHFIVEDDGPGISSEKRDEALKAFSRLDEARNQNSGSGVGLGLAIAADIARQHGGALQLGTSSALGGLKADLVLPR